MSNATRTIVDMFVAVLVSLAAAAQPSASITKPKQQTVSGGTCRITQDGTTLGANMAK